MMRSLSEPDPDPPSRSSPFDSGATQVAFAPPRATRSATAARGDGIAARRAAHVARLSARRKLRIGLIEI